MRISIHHPVAHHVRSAGEGTRAYNTIRLTDGDGSITLFMRGDWSDWDAIVERVNEYRRTHVPFEQV